MLVRRYLSENGGAGSPQATEPAGTEPAAIPPVEPGAPKPPPAPSVAPAPGGQGNVEELPEWAKALIGDLRKENASHRTKAKKAETEAEEAARKAAEEQGKFKDLYEAALKKAQEAEARSKQLEIEALKVAVAARTGLPAALAPRLQGDDEQSLEQDAKLLMASLPKTIVTNDAAQGTGGGDGQVPSMTPDEIKEFAARMGVDPKFVKPEMFKLPKKGNTK